MESMTKYIATRNSAAAMNVTFRSAPAGFVRSSTFIMPMPTSEARRPIMTVTMGSATASTRLEARPAAVAPMAIVATTEPT